MMIKLPSNFFVEVNKDLPNCYIQCGDRDKRHEVLSSIFEDNKEVLEIRFYHDYDYKSARNLEEKRIRYDKLLELMKYRESKFRDSSSDNPPDMIILADYIRTEEMLRLMKISRGVGVHWVISDYLVDTPYLDYCPLVFVIPPYTDYCKVPNHTIITLT